MGILDKILGSGIGGQIAEIVNKRVTDRDLAQKLEHEITTLVITKQAEAVNAAAEIVKTEAGSANWLAASWRPITMLTFVALIVARWLGWSAPNLSEAEVLSLWDIVELGLGGYVIGRSAEKILPAVAETFKK
jgi:hypothetical protein